jgi:curli biogenesis system outer membrane secretion channel CsgG
MRGLSRVTVGIAAATMLLWSDLAAAQGRDTQGAASHPAPYSGPKKRVAVTKFDAIGSFVAQNGGSDIGGGLAAQLITELADTGRFIVLERADLPSALREQELGLAKVATAETAAPTGQILGAQLLVRGSVTDFELSADGKGRQLGISLGGATIGLGGSQVTGRVAIDLRLIDATTGQIIESHRAEARVSQRTATADVAFGPVSFGNASFAKTPLGRASREAIAHAVDFIVGRMEMVPWTGRVMEVNDGDVYLNAGKETNLKPGQRLAVSTVLRELTDPATGLKLGVIERRVGEVEIQVVEDKFSVARPMAPMRAGRGDVVRLMSGGAPASQGEQPSSASTGLGQVVTALPAQPVAMETIRQTIQDFESAASQNAMPMLPSGMMSSSPLVNPFGAVNPASGLVSPNPGFGQPAISGSLPAIATAPSIVTAAPNLQPIPR